MIVLILLPTQLYPRPIIKEIVQAEKVNRVILFEHPHYFHAYKYNKKRILLHKASCAAFECDQRIQSLEQISHLKIDAIHMFEDPDRLVLSLADKISWHASPSFLLSSDELTQYNSSHPGYNFDHFYRYFTSRKSTDRDNRNKLPAKSRDNLSKHFGTGVLRRSPPVQRLISRLASEVNSEFPNNPGNTDDFIHPVTTTEARALLRTFVRKRLSNFAPFQDYLDSQPDGLILFHSFLSSALNIGIIPVREVLDEVSKNEAFIRQLFWREYQRFCYHFIPGSVWRKRYFRHKRNFIPEELYAANSGIEYVDTAVKRAFDTGYLHHIERLMVIGSYMLLRGTDPARGFEWFMEFSCDSYEWVMHQNVFDMVFFVTGGLTMRRPYFCSSNYIMKMSNYRGGDWRQVIDEMFRKFIRENRERLVKFTWAYPVIRSLKN